MNNFLYYFICSTIGVASLNFLNNYNSPYQYIPGEGTTVASMSNPRPPGDGATVASMSNPRPPGGGTTVADMSNPRPPGGNDSAIGFLNGFNWIMFVIAIIGAMLGGWIYKLYLRRINQNIIDNSIVPILLMAFIFSRATLFFVILLIDTIRGLI